MTTESAENSYMPRRHTFVTVAHAIDYGQLRLLARSMAMYCPADLLDEYIVVENFDAGATVAWRQDLLQQFGSLVHKVRFVPASHLTKMRLDTNGWWRQQVCKIAVSTIIQSERYVVLDCKNHLVRRLPVDFLQAADGRPRLNAYSFIHHPLRDMLTRTLAYLELDPAPFIPMFARTSTPYTLISEVAREIVSFIEEKERKAFGLAFIENKVTEFFLYSGYLAKQGRLWSTYDMSQPHCAQIWGHSCNNEDVVRNVIKRGLDPDGAPFIAIHRNALRDMNITLREIVAEFWTNVGLFRSEEEAVRFTLNPNGPTRLA